MEGPTSQGEDMSPCGGGGRTEEEDVLVGEVAGVRRPEGHQAARCPCGGAVGEGGGRAVGGGEEGIPDTRRVPRCGEANGIQTATGVVVPGGGGAIEFPGSPSLGVLPTPKPPVPARCPGPLHKHRIASETHTETRTAQHSRPTGGKHRGRRRSGGRGSAGGGRTQRWPPRPLRGTPPFTGCGGGRLTCRGRPSASIHLSIPRG